MDIEIGGDTFTKKPNILEEIAYRNLGQGGGFLYQHDLRAAGADAGFAGGGWEHLCAL